MLFLGPVGGESLLTGEAVLDADVFMVFCEARKER